MHGQPKVKISFSWLAVTLFLRIFEILIFSVGSQYLHIMLTSHLLVIEKHEGRHQLCFWEASGAAKSGREAILCY